MTASRRKTLSPWKSSTWQPWFCSVLKSRSARILSYFKRRDNKTGQKQRCQACENGLFFAQNQKKQFARLFACEKRRKLRIAERKRRCLFRLIKCLHSKHFTHFADITEKTIPITFETIYLWIHLYFPRETSRDNVEGELSGGEQAERRRSGETTLNKVRTQIKPYTIRVEKKVFVLLWYQIRFPT